MRSWITIGAPFGGATKALTAISAGVSVQIILSQEKLRYLEKSFSSIAFLLPQETVFADTPLMSIVDDKGKHRNLTAKDMTQIFTLLKDQPGHKMWKRSKDLLSNYKHPGVDVYCVVGKGSLTDNFISYPDAASFPLKPIRYQGDGDGTVNAVSAQVCLKWSDRPENKSFSYQEFNGIKHVEMAKDTHVVKYVVNEIRKMNNKLKRT